MPTEAETIEGRDLEVFSWRYEQLRRLGVHRDFAEMIARSDSDLNKVRDALKAGCTDELAVAIFA